MNEYPERGKSPKPVPDDRPAIIHKIFYMAECRGMSQSDLAKKLGVESAHIHSWKSRYGLPDPDEILMLSRLLGVSLPYLLDSAIPKEDITA